MYSFIVFKYVNLILWKEKYILGRICFLFLGIWGEAELILRIWGATKSTFRELRNFLSGIWGDQCIIFRDKGSTDPLPGARGLTVESLSLLYLLLYLGLYVLGDNPRISLGSFMQTKYLCVLTHIRT